MDRAKETGLVFNSDKCTIRQPEISFFDSSTKGLGAAILQHCQPVAFASKALNSAQSNYPNTDRKMLAVVFGTNR